MEKKRVAAYCRVSTDKSDQAGSLESQTRYFHDYIERTDGWQLFNVYADEGITGTSTRKRAAFLQMIEDARHGCFELILTKEISRFARNTLDSIYYTRELRRIGVGVLFLNDNINTLDADAELRLTIMSSIAQEESRKTSERVKWGQTRCMERGVVFGRSLLGYDVSGGRITVNPAGAALVRQIFSLFLELGSCAAVAAELNLRGVPTLRGAAWAPATVLKILRNEKYCGDLVQKKTYTPDYLSHEKRRNRGEQEFVVLHDHHEAIVPRDCFLAVQRALDARAHGCGSRASGRYPLSGRLLCGNCGAAYIAKRRKRSDGSYTLLWRCSTAVKQGTAACPAPALRNCDLLAALGTPLPGRIIVQPDGSLLPAQSGPPAITM